MDSEVGGEATVTLRPKVIRTLVEIVPKAFECCECGKPAVWSFMRRDCDPMGLRCPPCWRRFWSAANPVYRRRVMGRWLPPGRVRVVRAQPRETE